MPISEEVTKVLDEVGEFDYVGKQYPSMLLLTAALVVEVRKLNSNLLIMYAKNVERAAERESRVPMKEMSPTANRTLRKEGKI
jgi:hypothetical protein